MVASLTSRVKAPDIDGMKKMKLVICHWQGSNDSTLTLESGDDGVIPWWVDLLFAVYGYMQSHTGILMLLGKGSVCGILRR